MAPVRSAFDPVFARPASRATDAAKRARKTAERSCPVTLIRSGPALSMKNRWMSLTSAPGRGNGASARLNPVASPPTKLTPVSTPLTAPRSENFPSSDTSPPMRLNPYRFYCLTRAMGSHHAQSVRVGEEEPEYCAKRRARRLSPDQLQRQGQWWIKWAKDKPVDLGLHRHCRYGRPHTSPASDRAQHCLGSIDRVGLDIDLVRPRRTARQEMPAAAIPDRRRDRSGKQHDSLVGQVSNLDGVLADQTMLHGQGELDWNVLNERGRHGEVDPIPHNGGVGCLVLDCPGSVGGHARDGDHVEAGRLVSQTSQLRP